MKKQLNQIFIVYVLRQHLTRDLWPLTQKQCCAETLLIFDFSLESTFITVVFLLSFSISVLVVFGFGFGFGYSVGTRQGPQTGASHRRAAVCEQLAQGCYLRVQWLGIEPPTSRLLGGMPENRRTPQKNYGTFVPTYFRSRERKFHRWNFRSL